MRANDHIAAKLQPPREVVAHELAHPMYMLFAEGAIQPLRRQTSAHIQLQGVGVLKGLSGENRNMISTCEGRGLQWWGK